jgi:hypothetical protein
MNGRRKLLVLALAISPVLVIGAACSFPEVSFAPSGAGSEGGSDGGKSDSPVTVDGQVVGANEDVDPDGGSQEAATRPEGGAKVDAAGCTCDCDHDGFVGPGNVCDGGGGPPNDCDDLDDFIKPDAGFVAAPWTSKHTPADDWNCDGTRTKQYDYNQTCTDPNNCNGKSGFAGDPNCNEEGTFNTCLFTAAGLLNIPPASCKVSSTATVRQACK